MIYETVTIYSKFHQPQKIHICSKQSEKCKRFYFCAPGIIWIL